jgi:hypothetical protein
MKVGRVLTLVIAAFLCGSAASSQQDERIVRTSTQQEPQRYVRLSLKAYYENVDTNFKVDEQILPLSQARAYRNAHKDPKTVVDVCEYWRRPGGDFDIGVCEPHELEGRP